MNLERIKPMYQADEEECLSYLKKTESDLVQHLIRVAYSWGDINGYMAGSEVAESGRLPNWYWHGAPRFDRLMFCWVQSYGCVDLDFSTSPNDGLSGTGKGLQGMQCRTFRVFSQRRVDHYPLAFVDSLGKAVDGMVKTFLRGIQQENSYRACESSIHFHTFSKEPTAEMWVTDVRLIGKRWLCDECVDRFSLGAAPAFNEDKGKSKSDIERAKMTPSLRFSILERDGFTCRCCGRSPLKGDDVKLHVDHILPIAEGGKTAPENLHATCADCNGGKGARIVEQLIQ
jgi:hypothetical protein